MSVLNQFTLTGKTALVTGSDKGLGQAMAIALAEAGADIIGLSSTDAIIKGDTYKAVTELGRNFKGYPVDISNRDALYTFISE